MVEYATDTELTFLHFVAIFIHLISGILGTLVALSNNPHVSVYSSLVSFVNRTDDGSYLIKNPTKVFTIATLSPNIAVEFITCFFHILYVLQLHWSTFDDFVKRFVSTNSKNALRWVEYGITATIMMAFGNIAVGISDFYFFLKIVTNGFALQAIGYCIELLTYDKRDKNAIDNRLFKILYNFIGLNLNIVNVVILLYHVFSSDTGSSYKYYIENSAPFGLWFQTFGIVCYLSFYRYRQFACINFTEKWYILLSLSTKVATFWLSFGTFRRILEDQNVIPPIQGVNWNSVRYCAMTIPAIIVIIYAVVDWYKWRIVYMKIGRRCRL